MKSKFILLSIISILLFSSCGTQKFYVGDTSGTETQSQKSKYVKLFWIVKIGKKQQFSVANADGYEIITKYSLGDIIVSGLTGSIVNMKTVKFKAYKTPAIAPPIAPAVVPAK